MTYKYFVLGVFFLSSWLWAEDLQSVRFKQALAFEKEGKYQQALDEYKAVLLADPDNANAYLGAGNSRYRMKNYDGALKNYQLAGRKNPKLWAAMEGAANCYEVLGQKEKAVAEWRRIADQGPKDSRSKALGKIESLLGKEGSTAKASAKTEVKTEAATKEPSEKKAASTADDKFQYDGPLFQKALALYQTGDFRKSLDLWKKVLDAQPGNPGAFYYAGVCRYNLGDADKAIYNLQKSYNYPDKGYNAHYYLGRIYEKKANVPKAREHYNKYMKESTSATGKAEVQKRLASLGGAPKADPEKDKKTDVAKKTEAAEPDLPSKESCNLADAKRIKDSVALALKALEPKPLTVGPEKMVALENGKSFAFAATAEAGGADLQKALNLIQGKSFNQAIDALKKIRQNFPNTPNSAAAAYNLASLYRYLGLGENVLALAQTAMDEELPEPYLSAMRYQLAISLKDKADFAGALATLEQVQPDKELGPTTGQKLALASDIAALYKPGKETPELLRKAIAMEADPAKKAERQLELAALLLKQDDRTGATQVYKDMLDSCQASTMKQCRTAVFALGDMSYQSKNWPMAIEYYQKAADKFRDKENTPWARYQIGNVFRQQKRFAEAVKAYDQLIKEFPGTYWTDQAKWNREDVIWQEKNQSILGAK